MAAVLLLCSSAFADAARPLHEAIVIDPPDGCMTPRSLADNVHTTLERRGIHASITVDVHAAADDQFGFSLVRNGQLSATRTFPQPPEDCSQRLRLIAVSLALALDALELELAHAPPPAPAPPALLKGITPPPLRTTASVQRPSRGRALLGLSIGGGFAPALLPERVAVLSVAIDVGVHKNVLVRAGGLLTSWSRSRLGDGQLSTSLRAGRLDVCARVPNRVTVRGCMGVALGVAIAHGESFDDPRRSSQLWLAPAAELGVGTRVLGSLSVEAAVDGFILTRTLAFEVRNTSGDLVASRQLPRTSMTTRMGLRYIF